MIDLYCERIAPGLLAEPVNALTNVAFFIAAWASWSLARRSHAVTADIRILIALAIVIGTGSTLFHTFATDWARVLDELPILLFQLWYLWLYMRRIMKMGLGITAVTITGYVAVALLARQFPQLVNGSLVYAPALTVMLALGLYHFLQHKRERFLLLTTTAVFLASLAFCATDEAVCSYVPIGTHFGWHILNGVVLYLSMRALILNSGKNS